MTSAASAHRASPRLPASLARGDADAPITGADAATESNLRQTWNGFRSERSALAALIVLAGLTVACFLLPLVLPYDATTPDSSLAAHATSAGHSLTVGPSLHHPLGTDLIGRDVLARTLTAGRVSLTIGFVVALASLGIGTAVGLVAGYFGGWADTSMMWCVNVLMTIPSMPLLIGLSVLVASPHSKFGGMVRALPEQWRIIFVMSSLGWMGVTRIVRSNALRARNVEYVEACEALGGTHTRRMFLHVLPTCIPSMVVFGTFGVSGAIMGESFLSFLGVGVNPPTATWGNMIAQSSDISVVLNQWWLATWPSVAIFVTIMAINFVGEGLRVATDPKARD